MRRRRQRTDRDRHVEATAVGSYHVGEQESAPLILVEPPLKLPAHQWMQLGVLVDLAVDAHQQARGFQVCKMLLEVGRRAAFAEVIFALG